jgi:ankyrin repeat protein
VERLLAEGADPSVRDCDGDTALSLALERGHKNVVTALRRHAAKHATPPEVALSIHQAAAAGDGFTLLDCIDKGISPNLRDERGFTPLMLAAQAGQVASLRILVALGGSVRYRNPEGKNAWDLAADPSVSPIRVSLQEFGADNPQRAQDEGRFDSYACILGRYSHPFKYPNRNP